MDNIGGDFMQETEANDIELVEKHEAEEEGLDEEEKAMQLFNLGGKKNGREKEEK
jgi:hypothetical protein